MKYTAIDFETGNAYYTSACSIGVSVFEDGQMIRQYVHLIRPPASVGKFHWYNVKIHGIRRRMLEHEPDFSALWPLLSADINDQILVCHNAMFDTGVLRQCLAFYELPLPHCRYICTVKVAQKLWPELENHKLDTVSAALGIPLNHHEAGSDAQAAGMILSHALHQTGCTSVEALAEKLGIRLGEINPTGYTSCSSAQRLSPQRKSRKN